MCIYTVIHHSYIAQVDSYCTDSLVDTRGLKHEAYYTYCGLHKTHDTYCLQLFDVDDPFNSCFGRFTLMENSQEGHGNCELWIWQLGRCLWLGDQHGDCRIFQGTIVGGVRLAIRPMGGTEHYTQTDEQAYYIDNNPAIVELYAPSIGLNWHGECFEKKVYFRLSWMG